MATYLITGGCGGFGLETARWLADQGAGGLVLVGRRGAATRRGRSRPWPRSNGAVSRSWLQPR